MRCTSATPMSRVGKQPIRVPDGVTVAIEHGSCAVRGSKGELRVPIHPHVTVRQEDHVLTVVVANPAFKQDRALWGLTARLLQNAIAGITSDFERKLEIFGVGYRVAAKGRSLELQLGYSHPIVFHLPDGVSASIEKNIITITGADKQLVGATAARLRALKKPDAYHGKGVRYVGEVLKLKPGKAVKGAGGG